MIENIKLHRTRYVAIMGALAALAWLPSSTLSDVRTKPNTTLEHNPVPFAADRQVNTIIISPRILPPLNMLFKTLFTEPDENGVQRDRHFYVAPFNVDGPKIQRDEDLPNSVAVTILNFPTPTSAANYTLGLYGELVGGWGVAGGGGGPVPWAAKEAKINIVSVPQYLFASAQYATPIKFKISGTDDASKYTINSIKVTLKDGTTTVMDHVDLGQRFAADDGADRQNGTTDTYTCFIPHSFYNGKTISTETHSTDKAVFILTVDFKPASGGDSVTVDSSDKEPKAKPDRFADTNIIAFDIRTQGDDANVASAYNQFDITSGTESAVSKTAGSSIQHWSSPGAPHCELRDGWFDPRPNYAYPHEHSFIPGNSDYPSLMVDYTNTEQIAGFNSDTGYIRSYSSIYIMGGSVDQGGFGFKSRKYGFRRGGYFFVSYGGRDINVLQAGDDAGATHQKAMDLAKKVGNYDLSAFAGAVGRVTTSDTQTSDINVAGAVAGGFGIAWALTSGPWGMAFGTISSCFAIISSIDLNSPLDVGDGGIRRIVTKVPAGMAETDRNLGTIRKSMATTDADCTDTSGCGVGDQIVTFIEFDTAAAGTYHDYGTNLGTWGQADAWFTSITVSGIPLTAVQASKTFIVRLYGN